MTNLNVVEAQEIGYDWSHWNQLQNTFSLKVYDTDIKYPKTMLSEAWKWFCEEVEELHVDTSFFKYVVVTKRDVTWQVDFYANPECKGRCFSLYGIYFNGKRRKIMQAALSIS